MLLDTTLAAAPTAVKHLREMLRLLLMHRRGQHFSQLCVFRLQLPRPVVDAGTPAVSHPNAHVQGMDNQEHTKHTVRAATYPGFLQPDGGGPLDLGDATGMLKPCFCPERFRPPRERIVAVWGRDTSARRFDVAVVREDERVLCVPGLARGARRCGKDSNRGAKGWNATYHDMRVERGGGAWAQI